MVEVLRERKLVKISFWIYLERIYNLVIFLVKLVRLKLDFLSVFLSDMVCGIVVKIVLILYWYMV